MNKERGQEIISILLVLKDTKSAKVEKSLTAAECKQPTFIYLNMSQWELITATTTKSFNPGMGLFRKVHEAEQH